VRRRGYSPEDAQDLTQEFFSRLLTSNSLASVDRRKGKFRSFLLASMNHLLAKEWDRSQRQKRGPSFASSALVSLV
jgi:RNA polymerase sigma-70 factor (ECF subfamily)